MILTGQIIGWIAAILTFASYQCKEHRTLLMVQTIATLSMSASYFFLGAMSGMLLNVICIIRNLVIYKRNTKFFSYAFWPYLLALLMGLGGASSWQGPMSLMIIVALMVNTLFLFSPDVQQLRKSILLTSSMIMIYNIFYQVWGGVANELIAISSSIIGLYRFRNKNKVA